MSLALIWNNLVTYSLQIGLVVGLAAFVPTALRLRVPRARLVYWHILLAACLLLPLVRPWRSEVIDGNIQFTSTVLATQPAGPPARAIPWTQVGLGVLAFGILARFAWLGVGYWRLQRYRRRSRPIPPEPGWNTGTEFRISSDVTSPVTFGFFKPVVLLPPQFPALHRSVREAVLCHELLHVERRDWLFTLAEEFIRVIFWFHPAIWWLLGEIQLAREQVVDREVVTRTAAREEYVDALLAIAGARPQPDLAPAPLFLRKRHLKQRVVSILKEVRMSRTRLFTTLTAGVGILTLACWFVTTTFPLAAAPQVVNDGAGVAVDLGGATLLHRTGVVYPAAARQKGVQGDVSLEVSLDSSGAVTDARVITGPEELRNAAQRSVLDWHFAREAGATRRVTISFRLPAGAPAAPARKAAAEPDPTTEAGRAAIAMRNKISQQNALAGRTIKSIRVVGLSESASKDLLGRLPVHEGDSVTTELMQKASLAVKEYDEHLALSVSSSNNDVDILILAPGSSGAVTGGIVGGILGGVPGGPVAPPQPGASTDQQIRVGGNLQQTKLIKQPKPTYPVDAKMAGIQGQVKLRAVIAKDGTMKELTVVSGHPILVPAAIESVKQWVYQTTLLNGNPVEVVTDGPGKRA